jgi:8-oxo-dGTP pyrophosphatase MutT (NUDIX family)
MPDDEAHFELRLPDGSLKLRPNGTVMEFKPSAYMAVEWKGKIVFVRDCRDPARLQFPGGGIDIGVETSQDAAKRECLEEIGATVSVCVFVGQFETFESVHLFRALRWDTQGGFVGQAGEVSEIVAIPIKDFFQPELRSAWKSQFYTAQWKMLGWYLLYKESRKRTRKLSAGIQFPVFQLWSTDPWQILDSLQ